MLDEIKDVSVTKENPEEVTEQVEETEKKETMEDVLPNQDAKVITMKKLLEACVHF